MEHVISGKNGNHLAFKSLTLFDLKILLEIVFFYLSIRKVELFKHNVNWSILYYVGKSYLI